MNLKKRGIYITIGLLTIIISIFLINAVVDKDKPWHSPSEILVTVDGYTMTLEEAITNNVFVDGATSSSITEVPNPGHIVDDVLITINGYTMTLQEAINNGFLTGENTPTQNITTEISGESHSAIDIEITIDDSPKSLQDAIENKELVCIPHTCASLGYDCGIASDGCEGELNCGTCSPYVCQDNKCTLICAPCGEYTPPDGWCDNGRIVEAFPDECGCVGYPICCPALELIPAVCRLYNFFCSDNMTMVPGAVDECGCPGPPTCV